MSWNMRANHVAARDKFAAANGWKASDSSLISFDLLASGKKHDGGKAYSHPPHCDHPDYFRKDGYPVAIVAHNYEHDAPRLRALIDGRDDLCLHVPEFGNVASWYFPFHALPMAIVRPGVEIVWPTDEEMTATAATYFEERRAAAKRSAA